MLCVKCGVETVRGDCDDDCTDSVHSHRCTSNVCLYCELAEHDERGDCVCDNCQAVPVRLENTYFRWDMEEMANDCRCDQYDGPCPFCIHSANNK